MPIEDAADLAVFFDTDDFAETVTYTPKAGGGSSDVVLILDEKAEQSDFLSPGVLAEHWTAWVLGSAVPSGKPVKGDSFVASRGTFEISGVKVDDATGSVFRLILKRTA